MSADLFAEFGNFSQPPQKNSNNNQAKSPPPFAHSNNAIPASDPFAFLGPTSRPVPAPSIPPSFQSHTSPIPWMGSAALSQSSTGLGGTPWTSHTGGNVTSNTTKDGSDDEDGWGNFEMASPVDFAPAPQPAALSSFAAQRMAEPNEATSATGRARVVRASTLDLISNNLIDVVGSGPALPNTKLESFQETSSWGPSSFTHPAPTAKAQSKPKNSDPDVLFDAEDYDPNEVVSEDDGDDFGDFETVVPPQKPTASSNFDLMASDWASLTLTNGGSNHSATPGMKGEAPSQLLSTLSISNKASYPQAPKSPGFHNRNPFPGLAVTTPSADEFPKESGEVTSGPPTAWPTVNDDDFFPAPSANKTSFTDDWAAFDDLASPKPEQPKPAQQPLGWDWDAADEMDIMSTAQKATPAQPKAAAPRPVLPSKVELKQPVKPTPKSHPNPVLAEPDSSWDWDAADEPTPAPATTPAPSSSTQAPPDTAPAPTNIPPPSILLSLLPSLLDLPNTALFQPTASTTTSIRARILSDPQTATFLAGFLALATVAARLIAGRKLRWQRDRFLSQRMAISEVGGKGGRGMKLASIDRSQAARDDQAMHEVLDVWKAHIGKLRSAVVAANGAGIGLQLRIPELGEGMTVQTVKTALGAPKPCVMCGVKREERVKGVDVDVEDSFGEWWVEHWGHRACRNFWYEHEETLRSR